MKVNVCEVTQFNKAIDISTTHLGRDIKDPSVMKAPFSFEYPLPFTAQCHIEGTLQNGRTIKVLFNTGMTKSYLSRRCYDHNPHLHSLPKFKSYSKYLVVGNGQPVLCEFVIPLIIMIKEHVFEIYVIICDMTDSVSLVWGFKNIIETEGVVCTRTMSYKFLNQSPYLSPMEPFSL